MNAQSPRTVFAGDEPVVLTTHAQKRMQQRGISEVLVLFLVMHGKRTYTHGKCRYVFSGKGKNVSVPKELREKLRHRPCVIAEGNTIVTAKWQYARIKNKSGRRHSRKRRGAGK